MKVENNPISVKLKYMALSLPSNFDIKAVSKVDKGVAFVDSKLMKKDFEMNLIDMTGAEEYGNIEILRKSVWGKEKGIGFMIPSFLTLGTLNLLGFPVEVVKFKASYILNIFDVNDELVASYEYDEKADFTAGFYYNMHLKKISAEFVKQILDKMRADIGKDSRSINKKLVAAYNEKNADKQARKRTFRDE